MIQRKETGRFLRVPQEEGYDPAGTQGSAACDEPGGVQVGKMENPFPDVGLLESLGRGLDVSVGDLLAGKRIEAEHYQKRDGEDLLVEALVSGGLYGYGLSHTLWQFLQSSRSGFRFSPLKAA